MTGDILKLADFGAVGICFFLIVYLIVRDKMMNKTLAEFAILIGNHFEHETKAKVDLSESIGRQCEVMNKLSEKITNCTK